MGDWLGLHKVCFAATSGGKPSVRKRPSVAREISAEVFSHGVPERDFFFIAALARPPSLSGD